MKSIFMATLLVLSLGISSNIYSAEDEHSDHDDHAHKKETNEEHGDHKAHKEHDEHDDHSDHKKNSKKKKKPKKTEKHDDHDDHEKKDNHKDEKKGAHKGEHDEDGHKEHNEGKKDDHDDHDEHGSSDFGEGKAIVEVKNEGNNFKLSDSAIKTLEIEDSKVKSLSNNIFLVPTSCIVEFQDELAVYKKVNSWFELVEIKLISKNDDFSKIKSSQITAGDSLVRKGVPLLRVAHLQASGQGGKGHAH